ncbi:unnamed protein product [Somion occarium]|uniref:Uncharacterized protein n=1 Tax=Somion occarium TaxID=3059160 RepID=A0ABP1CUX9_9APHY
MSTGSNQQNTVHRPKTGGSPRTMLIGLGVVVAGLAGFAYGQRYLRKDIDSPDGSQRPTWQHRINLRDTRPQGPKTSNSSSEAELAPKGPSQLPLPGDDDNHGDNLSSTVMSVATGKGFNPDTKAPQQPENNKGNFAPKRQTPEGATYTKAPSYASQEKPKNYEKTPNN